MADTYDFIIAGGGSAASVAAMRLVRDFGYSVLIIERGPEPDDAADVVPGRLYEISGARHFP